jgi:hypothetical protein
MQKQTESSEYTIGQYYMVPTVFGRLQGTVKNWPVIGPMHEDSEIIGFEFLHYHIDWRFVSESVMRNVARYSADKFALVLMTSKGHPRWGDINPNGLPAPIMRRLKCKSGFGEYPLRMAKIHWLSRLEDKYQDRTLKAGICPHRGLPLDKLPCNHKGVVTCPGHGLSWNMESGHMIRYTPACAKNKGEESAS